MTGTGHHTHHTPEHARMKHMSDPEETIPIRLHGGPACWHGQVLNIYTRRSIEAAEFDGLGTLLIVDGDQLPIRCSDEDENPRAHYAPEEGGDRTVWHFQAWVPWGRHDPAPEEYLRELGETA